MPDLRTLRATAGESTASPEVVVEAILRDGQVPGGDGCAHCGGPTTEVCHVAVECERRETKVGGWKINPLAAIAGIFLAEATEEREHGRDVAYRLPVRMCKGCVRGLSRSAVPVALRRVEEYRRLLDKYPHAAVGRPEC